MANPGRVNSFNNGGSSNHDVVHTGHDERGDDERVDKHYDAVHNVFGDANYRCGKHRVVFTGSAASRSDGSL
jgi:hypothetical protein